MFFSHIAGEMISLQIKHVNKRILQMRPPDFLTRLSRDVEKDFKNLKGEVTSYSVAIGCYNVKLTLF